MRNFSGECCRENQNTYFMFNSFLFFSKMCRVRDNVEKYGKGTQATAENTAHALCMLSNYG
jgi:hypothetical protein